jgi:hypothetical protein
MPSGAFSHRLVDPAMSVNRNVTVPDGEPTTQESHSRRSVTADLAFR